MAEGPIHRKTIQQNLVNYISHNLGKKAEKDKETEKEKKQTAKIVPVKEAKQTEPVQIVHLIQTGQRQVHKGKVHPAHRVQLLNQCREDKCQVNNIPPKPEIVHQVVLYQQKVRHRLA